MLVREHAPAKNVDRQKAIRRVNSVLAVLPTVLNLHAAHIFFQGHAEQEFPEGLPRPAK